MSVVVVPITVFTLFNSSIVTLLMPLSAPFCTPLLFSSKKTRPDMVEGTISAKLLFIEPETSPDPPSLFRMIVVIWLLVVVGLDAVPIVPVLPFVAMIDPAFVIPFVVPVGWVVSQTE